MKAIYDSGLHHPLVAYVVGALLVYLIARQLPFLYGYLVWFVVLILADATVTGAYSPVPLGTPAYTGFSVLFILLGDLRYFVLTERVTRPEDGFFRTLRFSLPITFLIPVTSEILRQTLPVMRDDRVLYIVYESAMGFLVLGLDRYRFQRRPVSEAIKRYVHEVTLLFAGLYFGWAAADVLILSGIPLGHLVRIVPNVLYYAVFLVWVCVRAPESLKQGAWGEARAAQLG